MRIFRLHRAQRGAADYGGSLLYPGRWNPAGTPMLYAASTLSLACLEMLVHLPPNQIPVDLVYSWAELKETPAAADFRGDVPDQDSTRRFGQRWVTGVEAAAIRVPSVIIPIEFNVLLNPTHSEYTEIEWSEPEAVSVG
ncbi:MAG TPA: RES family NAD+ phosphorylase [Bryobacteraceae bacterium]|nr:RES family NAD+ phosphorylase [Bryobacteraceae bacterium]